MASRTTRKARKGRKSRKVKRTRGRLIKGGRWCGWDDDCPMGGKHKWGRVGMGSYKCQKDCGCETSDH